MSSGSPTSWKARMMYVALRGESAADSPAAPWLKDRKCVAPRT